MDIIIDEPTPNKAPLAAKYKRSFAYPSMKDRCPVILSNIVDHLCRDKQTIIDCYGEGVQEELKTVIGEVSQLKNQLQTGKPFESFKSSDSDTEVWNNHLTELEEKGDKLNYYETQWLFAECYLYRKIRDIFATKEHLRTLDPFAVQKNELLAASLPFLTTLLEHLENIHIFDFGTALKTTQLKEEFTKLMKCTLWANKFDLSLMTEGVTHVQILELVDNWDENIIINDIAKVHSVLLGENNCEKVLEYVLDNSGMELLCDLCLADCLVSRFNVKQVKFRAKPIPWYVSDNILRDFHHTISSVLCYPNPLFQKFGKRWQRYVDTGVWTVTTDIYWCLGLPYSDMPDVDPDLYRELSNASLIIFKGDLNYRKLIQDINWDPTTTFYEALGNFHPAPLVTIRTNKADLICGLERGHVEELSKTNKDWMVSGNYGIINFNAPQKNLCRHD